MRAYQTARAPTVTQASWTTSIASGSYNSTQVDGLVYHGWGSTQSFASSDDLGFGSTLSESTVNDFRPGGGASSYRFSASASPSGSTTANSASYTGTYYPSGETVSQSSLYTSTGFSTYTRSLNDNFIATTLEGTTTTKFATSSSVSSTTTLYQTYTTTIVGTTGTPSSSTTKPTVTIRLGATTTTANGTSSSYTTTDPFGGPIPIQVFVTFSVTSNTTFVDSSTITLAAKGSIEYGTVYEQESTDTAWWWVCTASSHSETPQNLTNLAVPMPSKFTIWPDTSLGTMMTLTATTPGTSGGSVTLPSVSWTDTNSSYAFTISGTRTTAGSQTFTTVTGDKFPRATITSSVPSTTITSTVASRSEFTNSFKVATSSTSKEGTDVVNSTVISTTVQSFSRTVTVAITTTWSKTSVATRTYLPNYLLATNYRFSRGVSGSFTTQVFGTDGSFVSTKTSSSDTQGLQSVVYSAQSTYSMKSVGTSAVFGGPSAAFVRVANPGFQLFDALDVSSPAGTNIDLGGAYYPWTAQVRTRVTALITYPGVMSTTETISSRTVPTTATNSSGGTFTTRSFTDVTSWNFSWSQKTLSFTSSGTSTVASSGSTVTTTRSATSSKVVSLQGNVDSLGQWTAETTGVIGGQHEFSNPIIYQSFISSPVAKTEYDTAGGSTAGGTTHIESITTGTRTANTALITGFLPAFLLGIRSPEQTTTYERNGQF